MNRDDAWQLLQEYTRNDSLLKHALAVEAAMRHYARLGGHDEGTWGLVGLLHDFDYERWPEPPDHTRQGAAILRQAGVDDEMVSAILSHAQWNQEEYPLDRPIRKTLFAVDELCGFLVAVALVRPEHNYWTWPARAYERLGCRERFLRTQELRAAVEFILA